MGKITIRTNKKKQLEIIVDKEVTARELLDGMVLYIQTISKMTGLEAEIVLKDLTKAVEKNKKK